MQSFEIEVSDRGYLPPDVDWDEDKCKEEYKDILSRYEPFNTDALARFEPGTYDVTFWCLCDKTQWQFDKHISMYHRCLATGVRSIVALITSAEETKDRPKLLFFSPPRVSIDRLFQPHGGWLIEFASLLDNARYVVTLNETWQFGVLRKEFPCEQRLVLWRLKTRDLYDKILSGIKRWHVSIQDLILDDDANGLGLKRLPHFPAIDQQYRNFSLSIEPLRIYLVLQVHMIHTMYNRTLNGKTLAVNVKSMARKGPDVGKKTVQHIQIKWNV